MSSSGIQCDIAIVGAGIAGLTVAHSLKSRYPDHTIKIFERASKAGGRILSENLMNNAGVVELGAGRYNKLKHKRLDDLMNEFSIKCKPFNYKIAPLQNDLFEQNRDLLQSICQSLKVFFHSCTDEEKDKWSFWEAAGQHLGEQKRQLLMVASGYDSLKNLNLPFSHGFDILFGHPETEALSGVVSGQWVAPEDGFQSLPDAILNKIKDQCSLHFDHKLLSIDHSLLSGRSGHQLVFSTGSGYQTVLADYVIQATPIQNVFNVDSFSISNTLKNSVMEVPLVKGYVQYSSAWWRDMNINGCCFTNSSPFRKIYFPEQGSHLLVYADGDSAEALQSLSTNGNAIYSEFEQVIKQAIPYGSGVKAISKPLKHEWKYWQRGISFWDGGLNILPQGTWSPAPNYFICSDMCTDNIGWTEGAIESAMACVERVGSLIEENGQSSIALKKIQQIYPVASVL